MTIRKEPSGRFRAVLKSGRTYVAGRTFDTKREATAWLNRERAALSGGVDPRAGRETVAKLLPIWLEERKDSVSAKTYVADRALPRLVPTNLAALSIGSVTDREVTRTLIHLTRRGLAESSVRRFRASLSTFFAWAVRERLILLNPVTPTRVPKAASPKVEMYPFNEAELDAFVARAAERDHRLAEVMLIAGWTGLRWSELRAVRVRDLVEVPMPMLVVERAEPEGVAAKASKSGKGRRVPLAGKVLPLVRSMAADRAPDEPLFTTVTGHRLHATAVKRTLNWSSTAGGRRIHDLRHTAACLWLARGGRSGDRAGVDGARVDRDDEHLSAPSGNGCGSSGSGTAEWSGARRGHT
ncbi:tyrosine-type recombinase/integrase [Naumannella halotolerans]|uniref:tyrosine-type recombinase/integrase n=1 Tax=Naumannella halotolerans TaxID=993414 RepID=UPI00370D1281